MKHIILLIFLISILCNCAQSSTLGNWSEEDQMAWEYQLDVEEGEQE